MSQGESRRSRELAEKRREHWEKVVEKNKENLPTADGKLPLSIRKSIAATRGITVEEYDSGVTTKKSSEPIKVVERGLDVVVIIFMFSLIAFLLVLFQRRPNKQKTETESLRVR